jgi:sialidase-1
MKTHRFLQTILGGVFSTLLVCVCAADEPQFTDVFVAGTDGFPSIRIPSVVVTKSGTVLALAEGRAQGTDQASNKLVLKRSTDGGRTWGPLQIMADDGMNCLNNPCAVVDQGTGRIIVMFQEYPAGHHERDGSIKPGLDGSDIVRNFVVTSDDDGVTWSKLKDVTRTTKHAKYVTIMASGPGIGIQLTRGTHAGRIVIPFNEGPFGRWNVLAVYSDDDGEHWQLGEPAPGGCVTNAAGQVTSLVNEVQMAELSDGSVMLNSRRWGGKAARKVAVSHDGGQTWSDIQEAKPLHDPGCMAAFFRYSFAGRHETNCLLFSNPDSGRRANGTIRASFDDGKTWPMKRVLWPGSFAYSALTRLSDGAIGCLFEADNCGRIIFARLPRKWLDETNSTDK